MDEPATLITGTRNGIGKSLVEHYARGGHHVVGCSRGRIDWTLDGYAPHVADVRDEKRPGPLPAEGTKNAG